MMEAKLMITCGIDWAEDHHDVALVDESAKLLAKRRIGDDVNGYRQLVQTAPGSPSSAPERSSNEANSSNARTRKRPPRPPDQIPHPQVLTIALGCANNAEGLWREASG